MTSHAEIKKTAIVRLSGNITTKCDSTSKLTVGQASQKSRITLQSEKIQSHFAEKRS